MGGLGRAALLLLLLPPACAERQGCTAALLNASRQAVEQLYLTPEASGQAGPDLLAGAPLPPGGRFTLRFPRAGRYALRAVLVNGRAVELAGLAACEAGQVTIGDTTSGAE